MTRLTSAGMIALICLLLTRFAVQVEEQPLLRQ
jgi:hypothetical protein